MDPKGSKNWTMFRIFMMLYVAFASASAAAAIPVLKFRPLAGSNNYPNFTVTLNTNENQSSSFSVCVRFKFNILSSQCIFESKNRLKLYFNDYRRKGTGHFYFANTPFTFNNDLNLEVLLNWQIVCVTYDQPAAKVGLFLNSVSLGYFKNNFSDSKPQLWSNFWLGYCDNFPFNGELTDFNVWSRYNLKPEKSH